MDKKKMIVFIPAAVAVTIGIAAAVLTKVVSAREAAREEYVGESFVVGEAAVPAEDMEYFCLADSQEEAEQIAGAYGIELVDFSEGVAVFKSVKPYSELYTFGQENNLKELSINIEQKMFDGQQ